MVGTKLTIGAARFDRAPWEYKEFGFFEVTVDRETDKAVRVTSGKRWCWLPKAAIRRPDQCRAFVYGKLVEAGIRESYAVNNIGGVL